jgi:two-component system, NtrC family, response regulator AtoC
MATEPLPSVGTVTIGRAADCDVRIDDDSISRRHAVLELSKPIRISDVGSANGTFIRDRRIAPNAPAEVQLDEVLRLGSIIVVVQRRGMRQQEARIRTYTYFENRLEEECARAQRKQQRFLVVHAIADCEDLAAVMVETVGQDAIVGAYAPGELELLCPDANPDECDALLDRIETAFNERQVNVQLGVAWYPRDGRDPNVLVARARARALADYGELTPDDVVVVDERMAALHELVTRVAAADISVLLHGETGVGKEVIAELLHRKSSRSDKPFLKLNCAAFTEQLLESELFGHERGAFTGAVQSKPGLLEVADGGVVFLDEIGELLPSVQAKLLRVLDERKVMRVGGLTPRPIDVRVISATNRNLETEVESGGFRSDLLYRLNAMSIVIPPLRERPLEIVPLARRFLHDISERLGRRTPRVSEAAVAMLQRYTWPGNVRELRNVIERALVVATGDVIDVCDLPEEKMRGSVFSGGDRTARPIVFGARKPEVVAEERRQILEALEACGGNQTNAAKLLGIGRRTLINRLEKFSVPRPRKR